jgi:hypothetical protein
MHLRNAVKAADASYFHSTAVYLGNSQLPSETVSPVIDHPSPPTPMEFPIPTEAFLDELEMQPIGPGPDELWEQSFYRDQHRRRFPGLYNSPTPPPGFPTVYMGESQLPTDAMPSPEPEHESPDV